MQKQNNLPTILILLLLKYPNLTRLIQTQKATNILSTKQASFSSSNNVITESQLKAKYGKLHLDLYSPYYSTRYIYKGKGSTLKLIDSQFSVTVFIYYESFEGFFMTFSNLKLEDRVSKIHSLFEQRRPDVAPTAFIWRESDIFNYNSTFKQLLEERGIYSHSQKKYELDIMCEVPLNDSLILSEDHNYYKNYFTSHKFSNKKVTYNIIYNQEKNKLDFFFHFIGFGLYNKFKGISNVSYNERMNQLKNQLKSSRASSYDIERLSFKRISIYNKDASKYVMRIDIIQLRSQNMEKNLAGSCHSESDNQSIAITGSIE